MKVGLIRSSILGKTIEFSARSVICVDPSVEAYQARVSPEILKKLWMPYFLFYVTKIKNLEYDYCYEDLLLNEKFNPEFEKLFIEFLNWMCDDDNSIIDKKLARLAFLNRPPTLFRHGIAAIEIVPGDDLTDYTIGLSPLTLEPYNAD